MLDCPHFQVAMTQNQSFTQEFQSILRDVGHVILSNFCQLSMDKYASNVVDKAIFKFPKDLMSEFISKLFDSSSLDTSHLLTQKQVAELISSDHGNFVMQNLFKRNKQI